MVRKTLPHEIAPYLKDASNSSGGFAKEVIIPQSEGELAEFLRTNSEPIAVAGAGTGVTAARIPSSGVIVSTEALNYLRKVDGGSVVLGPAVRLSELETYLSSSDYFYPPNPTEMLAFIGGSIATNASGPRSYKFGMTRNYVLELKLLLVNGKRIHVKRGQTVDNPLICDDGSLITFPNVTYQSPLFKNAAGYFIQPGMDWIDLFVGSDGTLAIITEVKLKLLWRPDKFLSGILFFNEEEACWNLVEAIKGASFLSPCSLEYFDQYSLKRLRRNYPSIPKLGKAALFFEQDVDSMHNYDSILEKWYEFLERQEVLLNDSWFAQSEKDRKIFNDFRHAIPLLINEENSRSGRVKIGTDMAVSSNYFMEMMKFYRLELNKSGLDYVVFGHIGDNHLHINLLPEAGDEDTPKKTYQILVDQILNWKGTVSAEHGIGKLKKKYFHQMIGPVALEEMKCVKKIFDPCGKLGSGNLW